MPNFIEPSVWPPNSPDLNPVDYAVWGLWEALQQSVYRIPISNRVDLKDRVRTCWESLDQQIINKSIDQWRDRLKAVVRVNGGHTYYGRPLSVSGCPCYILPMFYLFIFLWPPYSPALVYGSSRKFYTWWTLSVIRELTTWFFSWSSLNYRVGQKVTKFGVFLDPTHKLSALTP